MKRPLIIATSFLIAGGLLAGCTAISDDSAALTSNTAEVATTETVTTETVTTALSAFAGDLSPDAVLADNSDYTTVNDDEWSESDAIDVVLSGSGATSDSSAVTSEGSTVTITEAGAYRLSGTLDGQLVVDADEDAIVALILDGVTITNDTGSAITLASADDVGIYLAKGSENTVSDTSSYPEDASGTAAIFSAADLTISGTGALTVNGNGNDGIASKDDLVILSGDITVNAADDALRGKDSLVIEGGTLSLTTAEGDGMKSNHEDDETKGYILITGGTIDITAGDDGIQAETDTIITGGTITVSAADDGIKGELIVSIAGGDITVTESSEAIEAVNVAIFDGTIDVTASDDGFNAAGLNDGTQNREADTGERLEISGGTIAVHAGSDGLDSNGTVTITGGELTITSADNGGDTPLDANGEVTVADGVTIIANGTDWDPATANQMGGPGGGMPGGDRMPGGGNGGPGGGLAPTDS